MLSKVLKNLKKEEKRTGKDSDLPGAVFPKTKLRGDQGFQAKQNSQAGAERQRSMGNRMWKSNSKPK